jgi:hypothetical protein
MPQTEEHNYEFRTVPGVDPKITVSRDGEVRVNGRDEYHMYMSVITALDGTRMSLQMCIHKAFPDIPMRRTPTW